MPGLSHTDIDNIFSFHPPKNDETKDAHEAVRRACRDAAHTIKSITPDCAEQTTSLRGLQEAMMYANAALACHGGVDAPVVVPPSDATVRD